MSFDNIQGAEQWAAALEKLIDDASSATTFDERLTLSRRFREFIRKSRPSDPDEGSAIGELDRMARQVAEAMLIDDTQERLQAIARRANDLAGFQKTFETATSGNLAAARSIRLENLRTAIETATGVIESFNKVKTGLNEDKEEENAVKSKIDKAVKSVQDARNLMETLGLGLV